ncbi:General transcription and DNA repair factor IIH helicase subunit XPB [Cucumispora dikerogammari]|nr:General transcription and DNA repair factor IIH helicase subunit XPB [Cucumispora dikerogammari]
MEDERHSDSSKYESFLPKQARKRTFEYEPIKPKALSQNELLECPIYINYDGLILLEIENKNSSRATEFLITISEPISRPRYIHEYQITPYSLYAAASVGLTTKEILDTLNMFSKNIIPKNLERFIKDCTISYGKLKLIMDNKNFFLEFVSKDEFLKNRLLKDNIVFQCIDIMEDEYRIKRECLEVLKKRCIELDYPLIEEYNFRMDVSLPDIDLDLKPDISIRNYQETSLNKMFSSERARSGIIVLPCGAGKTLVGITAICTMKKSTLIVCTSGIAVEQWRQQLLQFSTIKETDICRFTADKKDMIYENSDTLDYNSETYAAKILITTYSMLSFPGKRSQDAKKIIAQIKMNLWGLLLMDEVHVVPAVMFRKVISVVTHKCKLGLTATLLREDDKIDDLNFLIGPKLYEADWQTLSAAGHISKVNCVEIWCEMTKEFYKEYLSVSSRRKNVLTIMNPCKFRTCEYLIRMHEARGDKIIVFSDNICALKFYAMKLNKPFIYGPTGHAERMKILNQFQKNNQINTIFLSKVGDTSIDLPEATVLIQISSHFGSRRQEAQRLGRILRARKRNDPGFRVFFYSLISMDTEEMFYSKKRRQFLIDQGYVFKTYIPGEVFNSQNFSREVVKTCSICNRSKTNIYCECQLNKKRLGFDFQDNYQNLPDTFIEVRTFKSFIKRSILSDKQKENELLESICMAGELEMVSEESEDVVKNFQSSRTTGVEPTNYIDTDKKQKQHSIFKRLHEQKKKKDA